MLSLLVDFFFPQLYDTLFEIVFVHPLRVVGPMLFCGIPIGQWNHVTKVLCALKMPRYENPQIYVFLLVLFSFRDLGNQ